MKKILKKIGHENINLTFITLYFIYPIYLLFGSKEYLKSLITFAIIFIMNFIIVVIIAIKEKLIKNNEKEEVIKKIDKYFKINNIILIIPATTIILMMYIKKIKHDFLIYEFMFIILIFIVFFIKSMNIHILYNKK